MKRIAIFEHGPGLWGAQLYLLRLAPFLRESGYEPVLFASAKSALAEVWQRDGFEIVDFESESAQGIRNTSGRVSFRRIFREALRTIRQARRIKRVIGQSRIDVIHANAHWSHMECALAGQFGRVPVVLFLHEESIDIVGRYLRSFAVCVADMAVAVSSAVATNVPRVLRHRVEVVQNGVDENQFCFRARDQAIRAELAADPEAPIIGVVNRLDPKKGVHHAIAAVAKLEGALSHTQLVIVGSGALDSEWETTLRLLADEHLGARCRFVGRRDDIERVLNNIDVFVLASWHEGLPLGVLEAQASGIPVVAYRTAGVPEVVRNGETGLLVDVGDIDGLAAAIGKVLDDDVFAMRLRVDARRQIEQHFTLGHQAKRINDLFDHVTRVHVKPSPINH